MPIIDIKCKRISNLGGRGSPGSEKLHCCYLTFMKLLAKCMHLL